MFGWSSSANWKRISKWICFWMQLLTKKPPCPWAHAIHFFKIFIIVDLQRSVNFCCTAKWPSYTYTHIFFPHIILHHAPSQVTGQSCATQQDLIAYPFQMQSFASPNPKLPAPPTPSATTSLFSTSMSFFSVVSFLPYTDSRYKWYHMDLSFSFWLTSLSMRFFSSIHWAANGIILFFFMTE